MTSPPYRPALRSVIAAITPPERGSCVANAMAATGPSVVGLADDHEDADAEHVLTWWQAIDKAHKLARGSDADAGRPATVKDAVDAYERDLIARSGGVANVGRIRKHLTPTLASKPVGLLTARELAAWRGSLLAAGMKPATVVRLAKATKAELNLAARRDHRIANRAAWGDGLGGLAEDSSPATCNGLPTTKFAP